MVRFVRLMAVALGVLGLVPSTARAVGTHTFNVCGGTYAGWSGFALCASVRVDVYAATTATGTQHVVRLTVTNLSGENGSYSGSLFTTLGLRNVIPTDVEVIDGSLRVQGPCLTNPSLVCDFSDEWTVLDDEGSGPGGGKSAGGVRIDLRPMTDRGVNYSIASTCVANDPLLPDIPLLYTSCSPTGPQVVTLSFLVDQDFAFDEGSLYIKGQNGYPDGEGSTVCITQDGYDCGPTTVVPEPITMVLLGTGLAGIGAANVRRRRKKDADAE